MLEGLVLLAWFARMLFAVRPVTGRGIPVGRGLLRLCFSPRQAVILGSFLAAGPFLAAGRATAACGH